MNGYKIKHRPKRHARKMELYHQNKKIQNVNVIVLQFLSGSPRLIAGKCIDAVTDVIIVTTMGLKPSPSGDTSVFPFL